MYEPITPDILHQLIKRVFKDYLVDWVVKYLEHEHGKTKANSILDKIDWQYVYYYLQCVYLHRECTGSL